MFFIVHLLIDFQTLHTHSIIGKKWAHTLERLFLLYNVESLIQQWFSTVRGGDMESVLGCINTRLWSGVPLNCTVETDASAEVKK